MFLPEIVPNLTLVVNKYNCFTLDIQVQNWMNGGGERARPPLNDLGSWGMKKAFIRNPD